MGRTKRRAPAFVPVRGTSEGAAAITPYLQGKAAQGALDDSLTIGPTGAA